MQFNIYELLGGITATGFFGWLFGRKREHTADVSDNLKIYQELINDLRKQFETYKKEMEKEIQELHNELQDCKKKFLKSA